MKNENPNHAWTWADQISAYTFWGLVIFFLFSISAYAFFSSSYYSFTYRLGISAFHTGVIFSILTLSGLAGFLIGWIIMKFGEVKACLVGMALLQIIGSFLVLYFTGKDYTIQYIGAALWGFGFSSVLLIIPSIIAGGRAGMSVFAGLYVIILVYERIQHSSISFVTAGLLTNLESSHLADASLMLLKTVPVTQLIIGTIFLIPIKNALFDKEPKQRIIQHDAYRQDVAITFLLNIIPVYALYFIYKIHSDLSCFTRSPKLLSRRGAFWITLLFTVTLPIITTTFYDVMEEYCGDKGIRIYRKWVILLFTIVFFPVTAALIQSDLNKLIAKKEES